MAGDSGGVFGVAVAVGEGGSDSLDKNSARRSTWKISRAIGNRVDTNTHAAYSFGS